MSSGEPGHLLENIAKFRDRGAPRGSFNLAVADAGLSAAATSNDLTRKINASSHQLNASSHQLNASATENIAMKLIIPVMLMLVGAAVSAKEAEGDAAMESRGISKWIFIGKHVSYRRYCRA
ncbi:uncharacterized protein LOC108676235 [Hyalella azteca]|uniref:Uncharacterized protein LOC108676235 n=1 Tax=Hyalella azteca TaxID=294128 RepID=A0A8B7P1D2_HYAAZ|nr:uncharacterized protein LOC108676235 [Hyalella azteca]